MGKYYKNFKNKGAENAITIYRFCNEYLGIPGTFFSLTHKDLKKLVPVYAISLPFEFIDKNMELLSNGTCLCVLDKSNNPAVYVDPNKLRQAAEYEDLKKELRKLRKTYNSLEELFEFANVLRRLEETQAIIKILKDCGRYSELQLIKKEIEAERQLARQKVFTSLTQN